MASVFKSNVDLLDNPNMAIIATTFLLKAVNHPMAGTLASMALSTSFIDVASVTSVTDLLDQDDIIATIEGRDLRVTKVSDSTIVRLSVTGVSDLVISDEAGGL